jgi:three-Cys-motif partner protein
MFKFPQPTDDGLYIPEVPEHSKYKHHFVKGYVYAFTTSMKAKKWAGLHYIDLFAGAGIERLRNSRELEWGSPMIAAQVPYGFTKLHLCEENNKNYLALKNRIIKIRPDSQILHGDANQIIHEIVNDIPKGTLSLSFLDPYGLHLDFETLMILSNRRVDLIIFFPDRLDALRNWAAYYLDNPESNLDRCLGPDSKWRERLRDTSADHHAELLRDIYIEQIQKHLKYPEVEFERIKTIKGQPLYYLIFCARHPVASRLWRRISHKKPDGQGILDFDKQ